MGRSTAHPTRSGLVRGRCKRWREQDRGLRPPDDQGAEVERLIDLGATRTDVGQPADAPWVVLADPEGNEFCVLPSRRP
ncbi:VOC family protein [Actinomadura xylanilytica]|uniref:VOC family protein n=1 Tax=Actinomadura xylanilytica TaxID=887459 RepID=UPI0032E446FC